MASSQATSADVGQFVRLKPPRDAKKSGIDVPSARSGHSSATDGTDVFVFGGGNSEMWCLNISTETWQNVDTSGDAPTKTTSMSMLLHGDRLLVFGGTSDSIGDSSSQDLMAFNLKQKTWSKLECTGQRPSERYAQAMTTRDDILYLYGGCAWISNPSYMYQRSFYSDLHSLDLKTLEWTRLAKSSNDDTSNKPTGSFFAHKLAWHDNKLYVVGSAKGKIFSIHHLRKIYVYNLDTNSWSLHTAEEPCPWGRDRYSLVQWKNEVYMCGGRAFHSISDDLWKLDLPSLKWTELPATLPVPTYGHSAAITPNKCMYIFGGKISLPKQLEKLPDGSKETDALYKIQL